MGNPLQDHRPAAEWASVQQTIEIAEKISALDGLAAIVEEDLAALDADKIPSGWRDSTVRGALRFQFADREGRVPAVTGRVTADVDTVCQRCLQAFQLTLSAEPQLLLLSEQETAEGYDEFEVWELERSTVCPLDIVEELLIMALPLAAMHDNMAECKAFSASDGGAEEGMTEGMKRPFAALRAQMKQSDLQENLQTKKDPDE